MGGSLDTMMRLIAVGLAALSLAMVITGTVIPRFWHSSRGTQSNGCSVDMGMGVANLQYKIDCSSSDTDKWETTLGDSCDAATRRSIASENLESCCKGRKAGFYVFAIAMAIQGAQLWCFWVKPDRLLGGFPITLTISTAVLIFYALAWLVVLGTCSEQLHTLSAYYNNIFNTMIGSTGISYINFKLEGSFVLYMLAYGCSLGAFTLNWLYFDDEEVEAEEVQEPTKATIVETTDKEVEQF